MNNGFEIVDCAISDAIKTILDNTTLGGMASNYQISKTDEEQMQLSVYCGYNAFLIAEKIGSSTTPEGKLIASVRDLFDEKVVMPHATFQRFFSHSTENTNYNVSSTNPEIADFTKYYIEFAQENLKLLKEAYNKLNDYYNEMNGKLESESLTISEKIQVRYFLYAKKDNVELQLQAYLAEIQYYNRMLQKFEQEKENSLSSAAQETNPIAVPPSPVSRVFSDEDYKKQDSPNTKVSKFLNSNNFDRSVSANSHTSNGENSENLIEFSSKETSPFSSGPNSPSIFDPYGIFPLSDNNLTVPTANTQNDQYLVKGEEESKVSKFGSPENACGEKPSEDSNAAVYLVINIQIQVFSTTIPKLFFLHRTKE